MVTVGVTGGIGSGKSTLCREWKRMGAVVVYADDLAKQLMVEDEELAAAIRSEFGDQAYHRDGSLNRSYLAEEAFRLKRADLLNELVHPVVVKTVKKMMKQAEEAGATLFAEEAALLLDRGRPQLFDYIVLITAGTEQRLERVMRRDGLAAADVQARMDRQRSEQEMRQLSDFVIENNGSPEELKRKARELYRKLIRQEA